MTLYDPLARDGTTDLWQATLTGWYYHVHLAWIRKHPDA